MSLYRLFPRKYSKFHEAPKARHKETEAADFRFSILIFGEQTKDLSQQGLSLVCTLESVPATIFVTFLSVRKPGPS